ncbi:MAG: metallophosphoesterase [Mesorhizobium sp.]
MPSITYAIGDVHGRADLLKPLLAAISDDAETRGSEPRVLFLGDIVDRGLYSRQSMDLVIDTLDRWPKSRLIRGNHDAYFLDFMTAEYVDETRYTKWVLRLGGYDTLHSYGLFEDCTIGETARRFRTEFPRHLKVLQEALPIVVDERFAYVHAGIDPDRAISDQDPKDLMMIREKFLEHEGQLSHIFVHGHTWAKDCLPQFKPWRIGIDTGAYAFGRLTCLAVSEDERDLQLLFTTALPGNVRVIRERIPDDRFCSSEIEAR